MQKKKRSADEEGKLVELIVRRAVEADDLRIFEMRIVPFHSIRLVLERKGGPLGVDVLGRVTRYIGLELDWAGHELGGYDIEAESPGINRRLRFPAEYPDFVGQRVRLRIGDGQSVTTVIGILVAADAKTCTLEGERGALTTYAYQDIRAARLEPELPF